MNAVIFMSVSMAALVLFLKLNGVPRTLSFDITLTTAWIYVFSFNVALSMLNTTRPELMDGLVPYTVALLPSALFSIWLIKRATPTKKVPPLTCLH
jgi:hypothetical protein